MKKAIIRGLGITRIQRGIHLDERVVEEAEEFLKQKGYADPKRVDFVEFSRRASEEGFRVMGETNEIQVEEMTFMQGYGVSKNGECFYVTIVN